MRQNKCRYFLQHTKILSGKPLSTAATAKKLKTANALLSRSRKIMRKLLTSLLCLFSAFGSSSAIHAQEINEEYKLKKGDILVTKIEQWETLKIINIDSVNPNDLTIHTILFESSKQKPTLESTKELGIKALHAPVSTAMFSNGWELIGNSAVEDNELKGFIEYLKNTNYQKYAEFTGQKVDELISLANSKYKEAYALGQQKKFEEAITLYFEAIDVFPMFIEAIDNIAFVYMDTGDCEEALKYFDQSLSIEPNGVTALYYKGQCYIQLRNYQAAAETYKEGMERLPQKKEVFEGTYLKLVDFIKND